MKTGLGFFLFLLTCSIPSAAQNAPRVEIFGGYSHLAVALEEGDEFVQLNGFHLSGAANATSWFGVTGEFSRHSRGVRFTTPLGSAAANGRVHLYLFGPRFTARPGRVSLFGHVLFGGANVRASILGVSASESSFAAAVGGGVDVAAGRGFAVRAIQVDYVLTRFGSTFSTDAQQHNARISTGVVFRFGGG